MTEENKDEKRRGAPGAGFENGLRSALDKAPGLAAPGWLTMQSAMAGGAAGGAAAAAWRWMIGPVTGAAILGGVLWFADPFSSGPKEPGFVQPVEESEANMPSYEDEEEPNEEGRSLAGEPNAMTGTHSDQPMASGESEESEAESEEADVRIRNSNARREDRGRTVMDRASAAPVDVPEDWAELPAEKAAAFGADIESACVGAEIGFRMANPMNDVRVLWNFGDGQFSSLEAPQHVFDAPGTYDITLSVTRISDGLIRTRTIENLVTIYPNPLAEFTWEVPEVAELKPVIHMRNRSRDAASSTWIIDGESTQAGEVADFQLERVGEHVVQLVASSPNGCQSVAMHSIEVGNRFGIGGSGRFSPNGDGSYDRFMPRGLAQLELPFVFRVEDEAGRIVFETIEPKPWDGTLPSGKMAAQGASFGWTVVVQGESGPAYFSDVVLVE